MKNNLLLLLTIISFTLINITNSCYAQTFQIKGSVKEVNDSIVYCSIQLMDQANNLISGTVTDNNGRFQLNNIAKNDYVLIVSSVGFQTDSLFIKELSKDLDVGIIYLQPSTTNLDEVIITAKSTFSKEGIKYVVPTTSQKKSSTNGIMLLDKMNLSRLIVDAVSNTIKVSGGGGKVQLRINGRETTIQEIQTLSPDEIIRIEYHDKPEARYNYAAVVLDYIVKHNESGGYVYAEIWNGLLNKFGEDGIMAKINHNKSEFSASYFIAYRDWNHLWRENKETFNLENNSFSRYEVGKPAAFEYYNHRARLSYNYQDNNKLLNVSLKTKLNNQVHKDWNSDLYSNISTAPTTMLDNSQSKFLYPSLSIYYQQSLNKKEMLIFSLFGMNNSGSFDRYYKESYQGSVLTNLHSNVKENQYIGGINFLYENKFKIGTLNIGMQEKTTLTTDTYNNTFNSVPSSNVSTLNLHKLYLYAQFGNQIKKWYYRVGIGANINIQNIDNKTNNYTNFRPSLVLTYKLNDNLEFSYNGSGYSTMPSLFALSDYEQRIDSWQIVKGNPTLKPQYDYYNAISVEYNKKRFGFSYYLNHTYTTSPLMESSYLRNDIVVRTIENHKQFQLINSELFGKINFFNKILTIMAYSGIKHYISNGNTYDHTKTIFYYGCDINVSYKKFTLMWLLNQNTYDTFWGETLSRDESAHVVSLSYNTSNFYFGIDCFNMFSTKHIASKDNYNIIAPYSRYEYLSEVRNLLRFKITYTFRYGRKYQANSKKIRNSGNAESGIIKGEK